MKQLTDGQIAIALKPYRAAVDALVCSKIITYISLLAKWNSRISLTTVTDAEQVLEFHFGESLFAASSVPIHNGRLADVGTGAGFPGLPLAIVNPELRVTLIEPNLKKCAFLSEVCRSVGLSSVEILRARIEDIKSEIAPFDFVTARALGQFEKLLPWAKIYLVPSGQLVLWVGESDADSISAGPGWKWRDRILIPGSSRRFLLVGAPEE